MAVTTTKTFTASAGQTAFTPVGIELNNQNDLDVYVTKASAGIAANNNKRILHYLQTTTSTLDTNHPQVNDTTGLYFPAITNSGGTETLNNYTISTDNNTITFNSALSAGDIVYIERRGEDGSGDYSTFANGSTIRAAELNTAFDEIKFQTQEARNKAITLEGQIDYGDITVGAGKGIVFEGATEDAHETTLAVTDPTADRTITLPNVTGTVVTTGDTGTVTATMLAANSVDSSELVDGSVDLSHMSANSVDSDQYVDGSIDSVHIGNDQINSQHYAAGSIDLEHMSANSVDSDQYVDGSIDLIHMSANSVGTDQYVDNSIEQVHLKPNSVDSENYVDGSIDSEHIGNDQIDSQHYVAGSINLEHMSANSVDSDQYVDGSIDLVHMSANSVDSDQYVDGSIDHVHLANDIIDGDNIQDDVVNSEHIAAGALDNEHYAAGSITSDKLNAATVVINSEQAAASTNDTSFFTTSASDSRYFRQDSTETIESGDTWSGGDTKIATTGAIDARIVDLVDDVGGFVPIANETSFPNTNPDINDGAGTLVSIKTLASDHTSNGSGVISISNGTVGNSTVTINGADNSTTYSAGYGMIVETTTTLNTYTFHRLVPKATEVTTVAGKATEIGRLGTAAAVEDLGILGTTAVVEDMSILGTTDCVADMAILGTTDCVADMAILGTTDCVADMALLGTSDCVADMALLGTTACIADMATIADTSNLIANIGTVAGIQANVTTVAGVSANVTTVATNINSVNDFAARYRVASSAPSSSLDVGDLYFDTTANELKVYNGSAWQGGVTATGNFAVVTGNTFTGSNTYNDTVKAIFGTSGDGLEIYHDGSNSIITDTGTGSLEIQSNGTGVFLQKAASEYLAKFLTDGAVELYHDNTKKFETTSGGATVTGSCTATSKFRGNDDVEVSLGDGEDLKIYHDGSNSYIQNTNNSTTLIAKADYFHVDENQTGDHQLRCRQGVVELYHNGVKTFETGTGGATLYGIEGGEARFFLYADEGDDNADKWRIESDTAGNFNIHNLGDGSWDRSIACASSGNVELFYDDTKKLETSSDGITVSGDVTVGSGNYYCNDNGKLRLGGSQDLEIYHNGTQSIIDDRGSGALVIRSDNAVDIKDSDNVMMAAFNKDADVKLYYDSSQKFATTSSGVTVTGNCVASSKFRGNDDVKVSLGDGEDLQIFHDGTNTMIDNDTGDLKISSSGALRLRGDQVSLQNEAQTETFANCFVNGKVMLYYDNAEKFETTSSGCKITGALTFTNTGQAISLHDDRELHIGSGDDLKLYHDGSNTYIKNITGGLNLSTADGSHFSILGGVNMAETVARFEDNGACKLYYDNALKIETSSSGVTVNGTCTATAFAGDGSSLTGISSGRDGTPGFCAGDTDGTTMSNTTWTALTWNDEIWDSDSAFASDAFTVPSGEGGKYWVSYSATIDSVSNGDTFFCRIYLDTGSGYNEVDRTTSHSAKAGGDGSEPTQSWSGVLDLSAGHAIKVYGRHNQGNNQTIKSTNSKCLQTFQAFRIN